MEECHRRTYGQAQVLTYHRAALCAYCCCYFQGHEAVWGCWPHKFQGYYGQWTKGHGWFALWGGGYKGKVCRCLPEKISGTYYKVSECWRAWAGTRWSYTGLLLIQQLYFQTSEEARLYYKCLHRRQGIQGKTCRVWGRCGEAWEGPDTAYGYYFKSQGTEKFWVLKGGAGVFCGPFWGVRWA